MLKKIAFAFIAALVLVNASVALTQPASASPNYFQVGTVTKAYRAVDNYTAVRSLRTKHKVRRNAEQGPGGAKGNYEYSHF
jgi:hypothetical protein